MWARVEAPGAAGTEVLLGTAQQFRADALAAIRRTDGQHAGDSCLHVQAAAAGFGPEAGMGEAHTTTVGLGDDKAVGVEEYLAEGEAFEGGGILEAHSAAAGHGVIPDLHQSWRIGVAKAAVLDRGGHSVVSTTA